MVKRLKPHLNGLECTLDNIPSSYKDKLEALFYYNHIVLNGINPNAAFFIGFVKEHINALQETIDREVKELGRKCLTIDATGMTFPKITEEIRSNLYHKFHVDCVDLKEMIEKTDIVLLIVNFSKSAIKSRKDGWVRFLIKLLDDAHFKNIKPQMDLIFIDDAAFLQRIWPTIGSYLNVFAYSEARTII